MFLTENQKAIDWFVKYAHRGAIFCVKNKQVFVLLKRNTHVYA